MHPSSPYSWTWQLVDVSETEAKDGDFEIQGQAGTGLISELSDVLARFLEDLKTKHAA